jgi:hypothetical protein
MRHPNSAFQLKFGSIDVPFAVALQRVHFSISEQTMSLPPTIIDILKLDNKLEYFPNLAKPRH